jgi:hypothetical protein
MEVPPNELAKQKYAQARAAVAAGTAAWQNGGGQRFVSLRPRGSRSPVDVWLADVTLVRLLQLGRAGRLHIGTNGP